jgi:hypothetical protein
VQVGLLLGGHREAGVVRRQESLLEIAIGGGHGADPFQGQQLHQAVLHGAVHPLHPPLGLRGRGVNQGDAQFLRHLAQLRHRPLLPALFGLVGGTAVDPVRRVLVQVQAPGQTPLGDVPGQGGQRRSRS